MRATAAILAVADLLLSCRDRGSNFSQFPPAPKACGTINLIQPGPDTAMSIGQTILHLGGPPAAVLRGQ
jgi:hypothetical protein